MVMKVLVVIKVGSVGMMTDRGDRPGNDALAGPSPQRDSWGVAACQGYVDFRRKQRHDGVLLAETATHCRMTGKMRQARRA
jgi:hypothetical protein